MSQEHIPAPAPIGGNQKRPLNRWEIPSTEQGGLVSHQLQFIWIYLNTLGFVAATLRWQERGDDTSKLPGRHTYCRVINYAYRLRAKAAHESVGNLNRSLHQGGEWNSAAEALSGLSVPLCSGSLGKPRTLSFQLKAPLIEHKWDLLAPRWVGICALCSDLSSVTWEILGLRRSYRSKRSNSRGETHLEK